MHGLMRVHDAKWNICWLAAFVIGPADGCDKESAGSTQILILSFLLGTDILSQSCRA